METIIIQTNNKSDAKALRAFAEAMDMTVLDKRLVMEANLRIKMDEARKSGFASNEEVSNYLNV